MKTILLYFLCIFSYSLSAQQIGFCMDDLYAERWKDDSTLFCQQVRSLGGTPIVRVAQNDTTLQFNQVKELIQLGIKVIVIIPVDADYCAKIVDYAQQHQVSIIAYDRLINNSNLDYYVSFDNVLVGKMQAEYALEKVPKGNYILLNGPLNDNNALMFKKGQLEVLEPKINNGDIKITLNVHAGEWTPLEGFILLNDFLNSHGNETNAIIAANDDFAEGTHDVVEILDLKGIVITGQDGDIKALKRILNKQQSMTVYKPISVIATKAATLAINIANNKKTDEFEFDSIYNGKTDVKFLKLAPTLIDISNVLELFPELTETE